MAANYPEIDFELLLIHEETSSFILIRDYVNALMSLEKLRDQYPTMRSLMPQLAKVVTAFPDFIKAYPKNFPRIMVVVSLCL